MKAGEKNYLEESNGTKANCNTNVTQVRKSRIYTECGLLFEEIRYMQFRACKVALFSRKQVKSVGATIRQRICD